MKATATIACLLTAMAFGSARADQPFSSDSAVPCAAAAWNTCATPFYSARTFAIAGGPSDLATYCALGITESTGCLAGVQSARLVAAGQTTFVGGALPGVGLPIHVAATDAGGVLSITTCNNDPAHCPGSLSIAIAMTMPSGARLQQLSDVCLVAAGAPPVGICTGRFEG